MDIEPEVTTYTNRAAPNDRKLVSVDEDDDLSAGMHDPDFKYFLLISTALRSGNLTEMLHGGYCYDQISV